MAESFPSDTSSGISQKVSISIWISAYGMFICKYYQIHPLEIFLGEQFLLLPAGASTGLFTSIMLLHASYGKTNTNMKWTCFVAPPTFSLNIIPTEAIHLEHHLILANICQLKILNKSS